ncbi:ribosomal protein L24 [Buchnera aphidicola str. Bp (Baizongia pistaciae)]|uniref:Large ribosomal subunit protein uL24 n=1 Tax=Buchnera aphidicola subsp. Baizongia pistaciae (strain Bp) TaxID=224915 RepID=RL24_BUCBP|nr:50S ribosomal protein L24 [Buchnera aphidicola]Q89A77.1 RecName: Full=Large ribosomal subunit protein uL24; AltName: Full=50S ribosomal protein L24 [Buchnera aphidicola str. Bp (Baizongia pistaciae)]AAO27162.1 ribosomal protein L24 [Buchnera aphidicola str. Bp (Baizongia pistaciae)]
MAAKIKKNDQVIVLIGKDKGKIGIVRKVIAKSKVIVEGVNIVKKHTKPSPSQNKKGGIVEQESSINISNIAILNPTTKKSDRIGFRVKNGKKVRFFKSNNTICN